MIRTLVPARHRERLAAWSMVAPALCITLVFSLFSFSLFPSPFFLFTNHLPAVSANN
jgi:hypothetical protein